MTRVPRISRRSLLVGGAIVCTALAAAAVGSAFTARTQGTFYLKAYNGNLKGAGETQLYQQNPFTILGKCISLGGGVFRSEVVIKTSTSHSQLRSAGGDNDSDFNPGDGEEKLVGDSSAATGSTASPDVQAPANLHYVIINQGGSSLFEGYNWTAAGHGAACSFGGLITWHMPLS